MKELKDKESNNDNKMFVGTRTASTEFKRRAERRAATPNQQFHMMHLLIAIFAGLGLGILLGKIFL